MPRYTMRIKIFSDESEIGATSSDYADAASFKAAMIAYYETGDLAGLSESVPDGSETTGGDYACWISEVTSAA